jgi:hypothetical protein
MDKCFQAIVKTLEQEKAHPDERCAALVRCGQIAQAYLGSNNELLSEVFGSDSTALNNGGDDNRTVAKTSTC